MYFVRMCVGRITFRKHLAFARSTHPLRGCARLGEQRNPEITADFNGNNRQPYSVAKSIATETTRNENPSAGLRRAAAWRMYLSTMRKKCFLICSYNVVGAGDITIISRFTVLSSTENDRDDEW